MSEPDVDDGVAAGTAGAAAAVAPAGSGPRGRTIPELAALVVVLLLLCGYFSFASPYFLSANNFANILTAIAVTGILAAPATMLLIAGQVDLSVGSATALCGIVLAIAEPQVGLATAVVLAVASGALVGVVNGLLVTTVGVNSLIVTLGGLAAFRGIAKLLSDGQTVLLDGFGFLGTGRPFLNIPMPVIILAFVVIVVYVVLRYTVYGRQVYAIGANPVAARLVGIPSGRVVFIAFLVSGVAAALAGLILTSQLDSATPIAATGKELEAITAVVLGGASLNGGKGSVLGTLLGLVVVGVVNNGLILLNVNSYWIEILNGLLLIVAVTFDRVRERLNAG